MNTVTSKDGTTIAFDQKGSGPLVIQVDGALQSRALDFGTNQLAALLAPHFTIINYDRRGRGDSTDTQPYALEREIEDIEALIDHEGGSAYLYGISSGAALAMEAAVALGSKVKKLAMYEAPYNDDETARQTWVNYVKKIKALNAEGRGDDAVIAFMQLVGMPDEHVEGMRQQPFFAPLAKIGHTLAYDAAALGDESAVPTDTAARVTIPTLVMDGSESYPFMHTAAVALAKVMPNGQQRTLEGQTHEVAPDALAPTLIEFFTA
ncbi:MAG: alpha/beta hydrolase [Burkholderiales bacterium]|nr:alpha/beta hydrolase [Anaerolineae bacterium]